MKITKITSAAYTLPLPPRGYSAGEKAGTKREWGRLSRITPHRPTPVLECVVVRIGTDSGVTGWGEATPDIGFFGETLEKVKSAIDMAVHDLLGRALCVPVHDLLGGCCRSRGLVALEIAGDMPANMAAACAEFVAQGVRAFKPKIGCDPDRDAERLKAIREAVGKDVTIRADANQGFTVKEAIRLCRLCGKRNVGLELLEQPIAYWDLAGMAEVKAAVDTLIEADESAFSIHDAMNIIRQRAADVINIKIEKVGGFYNAKKVAAMAEASGLQCAIGTAFGLGFTIAAKLHLAASTLIIRDTVEFTEVRLHDNLFEAPFDRALTLPLRDGCFEVPAGPGLGVTFDETRAAAYRSTIVD